MLSEIAKKYHAGRNGNCAQSVAYAFAQANGFSKEKLEELMLNPLELVKDVGTMLEGKDAVEVGLIDEVGGMKDAVQKLREMIY